VQNFDSSCKIGRSKTLTIEGSTEEGMSKKVVTRRELLDRWRGIEEEDEEDDIASVDPLKRHRFRQLKEEWSCSQFHQNYIFPISTCASQI